MKSIIPLLLLGLLLSTPAFSTTNQQAKNFLQHEKARAFIQEMIRKHKFSERDLNRWFAAIRPRPDIIEAISHPAEATKPWYEYRRIFLVEKRIRGGVDFMRKHAATLLRAEKSTGVPAEIIVAILGVETLYNRYKGRHFVLESLATLAFDYPKRSRFFRRELEQFLLLAREEGVDPLALKGSYAGAMGGPQFISSSFRRYAVDFDGDGKRDIWNNPVDMIGSVANYFRIHGWKKYQGIIYPARVRGKQIDDLLKNGVKPRYRIGELAKKGVVYRLDGPEDVRAALIKLELEQGPAYWLGPNNFYVITRYNHSPLYAMAVVELSEAIRKRFIDGK